MRKTGVDQYDVLIIGCGAAGMSLALQLAGQARVAVLSKGALTESVTAYAQGGIAAAIDTSQDSAALHAQDTLQAGAGLCDEAVVNQVTGEAPAAMQWLLEQGMMFSKEKGQETFHLMQEGGHSRRRILHADDATGQALMQTLLKKVLQQPSIDTFAEHTAIDLVIHNQQCVGAYVLDNNLGEVKTFRARHVVLAAGGASKVYLYTSNPDCASGDGIAMAWRAGAGVRDLEFNQFHPTCLYHPHAKSFLLTEALRGEGARIILPSGERFLTRHHPRGELAPRDIVARAIDYEMKRLGIDCVYLDISHRKQAFILAHFPTIHRRCLALGIDMTRNPIPTVPAAHYTCGGVETDKSGLTTVPHLYAVGEVACTGMHGANRLASNSLLECVVMGGIVAKTIKERLSNDRLSLSVEVPPWDASRVTQPGEKVTICHSWQALRQLMWDYVGIVRSEQRLKRALEHIYLLKAEVHDYYGHYRVNKDLIELRNLVQVAELIVKAALARKTSLGLHSITH